MRLLLCASLLVAFASGCYATTTGYVGTSATVTTTTVAPDLVYVSPGVQVIADYDEPIFYSDGYYWRESGGIWYRSSVHTGGWISYRAPSHVLSIRNRHSYRHYRPTGYTPRARRDYRDNRDYRRDNRDYRRDNRRDNRTYERPTTRDNRTYNRPTTRDNRTYERPTTRDNRTYNRPTTRDNRTAPTTRDNRRREHRDDDRYDHKRHR